jgi:PAS domain S-box-containing protein
MVPMDEDAISRAEPTAVADLDGDARFRLLVDSLRDYAVFMMDPEGHIVTWNSGAEHIKGYATHEIIGQHFSRFYLREDVERGKPDWELEIAKTNGRYQEEGWRVRKDGSRFWASVMITAIRERGGRLIGYAQVTRDLTERRHAEEVSRRLIEEREVRRGAEAAVATRDDFIAVAGHELKTPLSSLLLDLQSTLRVVQKESSSGKDGSTSRVRERLERAVASAAHLGKLIDQLLDVSRITAGRLRLRWETFNLTDLVKDVIARLSEVSNMTHTPITLDAEPVINGSWDRDRLEQVVVNLVSNALKYGRGRPVEVRLAATPQQAELRVRDHGIGINPDQQGRIFERYERAVEERDFGGFGLGLWISKQIVTASGGRIQVISAVGEGATFLVELPRSPAETEKENGDVNHDP